MLQYKILLLDNSGVVKEEVTSKVDRCWWDIRSWGSNDIFHLELKEKMGTTSELQNIVDGWSIEIYVVGNLGVWEKRYCGFVSSVKRSVSNYQVYTLDGIGYTLLLQRAWVTNIYTTQTVKQLVINIIDNYVNRGGLVANAAACDATTLIDDEATFETWGVQPGWYVRNVTEDTYAKVISVDSETQLTTSAVGDWTSDTYSVGKIWYDSNQIVGAFSCDKLVLDHSALGAIKMLAMIQGSTDFGVTADKEFYFKAQSSTTEEVLHRDREVEVVSRDSDTASIVNKVNLYGGFLAGADYVKKAYTKTYSDATSITSYGTRERTITQTAIVTETVGLQYCTNYINYCKDIFYRTPIQFREENLLTWYEYTFPFNKVRMSYDDMTAEDSQIDSIRYSIFSDTLYIGMILGKPIMTMTENFNEAKNQLIEQQSQVASIKEWMAQSNIIRAAMTGGDYNGANAIVNAVAAITDNASDNVYIITVGPGTYSGDWTAKPYVYIIGDSKETVLITGTVTINHVTGQAGQLHFTDVFLSNVVLTGTDNVQIDLWFHNCRCYDINTSGSSIAPGEVRVTYDHCNIINTITFNNLNSLGAITGTGFIQCAFDAQTRLVNSGAALDNITIVGGTVDFYRGSDDEENFLTLVSGCTLNIVGLNGKIIQPSWNSSADNAFFIKVSTGITVNATDLGIDALTSIVTSYNHNIVLVNGGTLNLYNSRLIGGNCSLRVTSGTVNAYHSLFNGKVNSNKYWADVKVEGGTFNHDSCTFVNTLRPFLVPVVKNTLLTPMTGWSKVKGYAIPASADGTLTNYQLKFTINRSAGIDVGQTLYVGDDCEADYDDIRFTNAAGDLLDYWIESSSASSAVIVVEVDEITAVTGSTIYIHYGNASAPAVSNGDNTYLAFDDFSGTLTDKWDISGGTPAIESGKLNIDGATADTVAWKTSITGPYIFEVECDTVSIPGAGAGVGDDISVYYDSVNNYYVTCYYYNSGGIAYRIVENGPTGLSFSATAQTETAGVTYSYRMYSNGSNAYLYRNNVLMHSRALTKWTTTNGKLRLSAAQAGEYNFYNVRVRKYTANPPAGTGVWTYSDSYSANTGVVNNLSDVGDTVVYERQFDAADTDAIVIGSELSVDSCDTDNWTDEGNGTSTQNVTTVAEGTAALNLLKSSGSVSASESKATTSRNGAGQYLYLHLYIKDATTRNKLINYGVVVKFGSDNTNYVWTTFEALNIGWNFLIMDVSGSFVTGSPVYSAMNYCQIIFNTNLSTDTFAAGDLIMDYWFVDSGILAIDSDRDEIYTFEFRGAIASNTADLFVRPNSINITNYYYNAYIVQAAAVASGNRQTLTGFHLCWSTVSGDLMWGRGVLYCKPYPVNTTTAENITRMTWFAEEGRAISATTTDSCQWKGQLNAGCRPAKVTKIAVVPGAAVNINAGSHLVVYRKNKNRSDAT